MQFPPGEGPLRDVYPPTPRAQFSLVGNKGARRPWGAGGCAAQYKADSKNFLGDEG